MVNDIAYFYIHTFTELVVFMQIINFSSTSTADSNEQNWSYQFLIYVLSVTYCQITDLTLTLSLSKYSYRKAITFLFLSQILLFYGVQCTVPKGGVSDYTVYFSTLCSEYS